MSDRMRARLSCKKGPFSVEDDFFLQLLQNKKYFLQKVLYNFSVIKYTTTITNKET